MSLCAPPAAGADGWSSSTRISCGGCFIAGDGTIVWLQSGSGCAARASFPLMATSAEGAHRSTWFASARRRRPACHGRPRQNGSARCAGYGHDEGVAHKATPWPSVTVLDAKPHGHEATDGLGTADFRGVHPYPAIEYGQFPWLQADIDASASPGSWTAALFWGARN